MKGFLFVAALAGIVFAVMALYARLRARTDPVDPEALKQSHMTSGGDGSP